MFLQHITRSEQNANTCLYTFSPLPLRKKKERSSLQGAPGYFFCSWGLSRLSAPDGVRGCHQGRSGQSHRTSCQTSGESMRIYSSTLTTNLLLVAPLWCYPIKIYPSKIPDTLSCCFKEHAPARDTVASYLQCRSAPPRSSADTSSPVAALTCRNTKKRSSALTASWVPSVYLQEHRNSIRWMI